jgi:hypothetical protein
MSSISLVTPTYWRDRDFCALLCESVDRHLTSYVKHYLIVADDELRLFKQFNGTRRVVVPTSHVLPSWLKPLPRFVRKNRGYWWSLRTAPISDWHVERILKIAAGSGFPEERCCILDTDVVFFRRFDLSPLQRPKPTPLFMNACDVTVDARPRASWVRSTHRLLGLAEPQFPAPDFIGDIITWDRTTVRAMVERIESVTGMEWTEALCRVRDFSEYMLYGFFVQNSHRHRADHSATTRKQCLRCGSPEPLDRPALERLLGDAHDDHVALSAASFSSTSPEVIRASLSGFADARRVA